MLPAYRRLLLEPGIRNVLLLSLLGKMPALGITPVLILHVVGNLDRGFGAGSLVAAGWSAGVGLGAPVQGRALDRFGLRRVVGLLMIAQTLFWGLGPVLPYAALLVAAVPGGLTAVPVFTVVRLALSNVGAETLRHTAFAADAITTDVAYLSGPSIGILLASATSPRVAFLAMGALVLLVGAAFRRLDPALPRARAAPARGGWLTPRMLFALGLTAAISIAVMGFEVAAIGMLAVRGQLAWSWLVLVTAGLASVAGGLVYGSLRRPPPAFVLGAGLGLLCVPIGLATQWYWLCLLAVPANLLVAPALSASAGAVGGLAPEESRGVAMGSYATAIMAGSLVGSPLAGFVLDHGGPAPAFAVLGTVTAVLSALACVADRKGSSRQRFHR